MSAAPRTGSARLRRVALRVSPLVGLALTAACPRESFVQSIVGTYVLVSVDGEALPVTAGTLGDLTSGEFELTSDNRCTLTLVYTQSQETDTCAWARSSSTVTFTWSDESLSFFVYTQDRLAGPLEGLQYVFER